jgi:hypothetical protein
MTSIVTSRSVKPCCANRSTSFWSAVLTRTKPCMSIWTASPYPQSSANGVRAKLRKFILTATSIPVPLRDDDDALLVKWEGIKNWQTQRISPLRACAPTQTRFETNR